MKEIRHTGIVVTDMQKSLKFYKDILGMKVIKDFKEKGGYIDGISGLSGVNLHMVKLIVDDGSMIELLQYISHPGKVNARKRICDIGCSHIAFTVENIEKDYRRLLKHGIKFNSPPMVSPDGYAKVAFCHDPDGTAIELVEVIHK